MSRWRSSASARWATAWRPARCAPASRPSSGTATPKATRDLAELGAEVAESAADAARRAAIVVTMVTDADAVVAIARDEGMLGGAPAGSDLGADEHDRSGRHRARRGPRGRGASRRHARRRPVSGSKDPAERGELTIFASGPESPRRCVAPLFDALGHRTIWVGPAGTGTRVKIVNNTWLAFAGGGGRRVGRARSPVGPRHPDGGRRARRRPARVAVAGGQAATIVNGDFSPQFALSLALKDVRLALDVADDDRFAALGRPGRRVGAGGRGRLGDQDLTVVTRALEQQGGAR